MQIGLELMASRMVSVVSQDTLDTAVLWNGNKTSIGRDVYPDGGMVWPDRRLAATGRIHFLSFLLWEPLQSTACHPVECPNTPCSSFVFECRFPASWETFPHDFVSLSLVIKEEDAVKQHPLPIIPSMINGGPGSTYRVELTDLFNRHLESSRIK